MPNKAPVDGSYRFSRITEQLSEPGEYVLQFELTPALAGRAPLSLATRIVVCPGEPKTFEIKVKPYSHVAAKTATCSSIEGALA